MPSPLMLHNWSWFHDRFHKTCLWGCFSQCCSQWPLSPLLGSFCVCVLLSTGVGGPADPWASPRSTLLPSAEVNSIITIIWVSYYLWMTTSIHHHLSAQICVSNPLYPLWVNMTNSGHTTSWHHKRIGQSHTTINSSKPTESLDGRLVLLFGQ